MADTRVMAVLTALLVLVASGTTATAASCITGCTCETGIMKCSNLDYISQLQPLPANITSLEIASSPFVFGAGFSEFPKELSPIRTLIIKKCDISTLESDTFINMANLENLEITANYLDGLKGGLFRGLSKLSDLVIEDNHYSNGLDIAENTFDQLPSLKRLRIVDSYLKTFPHVALSKLVYLESLQLDGSEFSELKSGEMKDLSKLTRFTCHRCNIERLDKNCFEGLTSLQELNLGYNRLVDISRSVTNPFYSTVTQVLLSGNQLRSLDADVFDWSRLTQLKVDHNPWNCDCQSLTWSLKLDFEALDSDNHQSVNCTMPEPLKGMTLTQAAKEQGCAPGHSVVALAIVIPILIICALLIGYYLFKIIRNRRHRAEQRKGIRYSSVYKDTVESAKPGQQSLPASQI